MANNKALRAIQVAKKARLLWVSHAYELIQVVPVMLDQSPYAETECIFGKWIYGEEGRQLAHLSTFKDLEASHRRLHQVYKDVFKIVVRQHSGADLLRFLLGMRRAISDEQQRAAMSRCRDLQMTSDQVSAALDALEAEVTAEAATGEHVRDRFAVPSL